MRNTVFDYVGNLDTLLAVVVGALLATLGALFAEIIQDRRQRKRRERDAARFFGDILSSFDRVLDFAFRSQTTGDPWGKTTLRIFKTAQKEANVYERNRERLFDIHDMKLRGRIHSHFLRETFALGAIVDNCTKLIEVNERLNSSGKISKTEALNLTAETKQLNEWLDAGIKNLKSEKEKTAELCTSLESIAKVKFDYLDGTPPIIPSKSISDEDDKTEV